MGKKVLGTLMERKMNKEAKRSNLESDSNEFENVNYLLHQNTFQSCRDYISALSYFGKSERVYLASGSYFDNNIIIWDVTDTNKFKVSATIPTSSRVKSIVTFKVDGSPFLAYGCNKSYEINVWNLVNYQLDYSLKGHTGNINALKNYERNGNIFLVSGSNDNTIKVWCVLSKQCIHTFESYCKYRFSFDIYEKEGRWILVSGGGRHDRTRTIIQLWDLEAKSTITTLTCHKNFITAVKVFHKQGNPYLASGSWDKTIKIWKLTDHLLKSTLIGHRYINALELIRTNNKLYLASGSDDNTIKLWDLKNYTIMKTFKIQSPAYSLITLTIKNMPYLFSGHNNGEIMVWSENVARELFKLQKKGYGTSAKPVYHRDNLRRKYKINTKEKRPGLPKDICKYIAEFL